jgi:uracil phosphoribosyltransferase
MAVNELKHPLFADRLAVLRATRTGHAEFRSAVDQISGFLAYEVAGTLPRRLEHVQTPLAVTECEVIARESVVLAPILRAGLGLIPGVQRIFPGAPVLHLGIYRDEESLKPIFYYRPAAMNLADKTVLVLDPMLATGGTLAAAIDLLLTAGAERLAVLCLIASRSGIDALAKRFSSVDFFAGAVDAQLNENGYIVPGLGDAGDRMFGTEVI